MTNDDFGRRVADTLKRQADAANMHYEDLALSERLTRAEPMGRQAVGVAARAALVAAASVAAIAVGIWISNVAPQTGRGSLATPSAGPTTSDAIGSEIASPTSDTATPVPSAEPPTPFSSPTAPSDQAHFAEVTGGPIAVYALPSTQGPILDTIPEGRIVWVHSTQTAAGEPWARLQFMSLGWNLEDLFAWAPITDQLRSVDPPCPEHAVIPELGAMSAAQHLACFGSRELTFVGFAVEIEAGESAYVGTPTWLAEPSNLVLRGSDAPAADTGRIAVHLDPAAGIAIPVLNWVEVTGHFDDAAAAECDRDRSSDALSEESENEQRFYCRERFVVTRARVVDAPNFPTPGPDV